MLLSPGQLIEERYQVNAIIGVGGTSEVYQVFDQKFSVIRALKVTQEISESVVKQIVREAQILVEIRHPNLPQVHDYFIKDGHAYLIMDYIEGDDLRTLLDQQNGPLPLANVKVWINQICEALKVLHNQEMPIIHRDIKPENIRIQPDGGIGKAVLVDFGISKFYDPEGTKSVSSQWVTKGYSSPEQYGDSPTDARSDIYSLGATVYTLLTNVTPPSSTDILGKFIDPPERVDQVNPLIPYYLTDMIEKAMKLSPEDRFSSIEQFQKEFNARPHLLVQFWHRFPKGVKISGPILVILCLLGILYFKNNSSFRSYERPTIQPTVKVNGGVAPSFTPQEPSATIKVIVQPSATIKVVDTQTPTLTSSITASLTSTPSPVLPNEILRTFRNSITPDPDTIFSSLIFATGLDAQYHPVNPGTAFDKTIKSLYAFFTYDHMVSNVQWTAVWYRDGKWIFYETKTWDGGAGGLGYTVWTPKKGECQPGDYEVQLFVGQNWKVSGTFVIFDVTETPTQWATIPSQSRPYATATPARAKPISPTTTPVAAYP